MSFIGAGLDQNEAEFHNAPDALKAFLECVGFVPGWADKESFEFGCCELHRDSVLPALRFMVGSISEAFATSAARPFFAVGNLTDLGVHRLTTNVDTCSMGMTAICSGQHVN